MSNAENVCISCPFRFLIQSNGDGNKPILKIGCQIEATKWMATSNCDITLKTVQDMMNAIAPSLDAVLESPIPKGCEKGYKNPNSLSSVLIKSETISEA